jgi:hypothetical protein
MDCKSDRPLEREPNEHEDLRTRRPAGASVPYPGVREHPVDEVLAQARVVQPAYSARRWPPACLHPTRGCVRGRGSASALEYEA